MNILATTTAQPTDMTATLPRRTPGRVIITWPVDGISGTLDSVAGFRVNLPKVARYGVGGRWRPCGVEGANTVGWGEARFDRAGPLITQTNRGHTGAREHHRGGGACEAFGSDWWAWDWRCLRQGRRRRWF